MKRKNKKKRAKSGHVISTSEPDLVTAKKRWDSGFPPGVTVDELWRFRKRRPPAETQPHDNLITDGGSLKDVRSEYSENFGRCLLSASCSEIPQEKVALDAVKVDEVPVESDDSLIDDPSGESRRRRRNADIKSMENIHLGDVEEGRESNYSSELRDTTKNYPLRRSSNLKLEGELQTTTEKAEKFIEFLLTNRPPPLRKPTTLKLEGEMDVRTENREKFVPFQPQQRPPLCKKHTNLHLEGDLETLTENHAKYIPYSIQERPHLTKRDTNLHLEGELKFDPEYRTAFVPYKIDRSAPFKPHNNLTTEGDLDVQSETTSKFLEHHVHPTIPFLRGDYRGSHISLGEDSGMTYKPEYRENFVTYPRTERLKHSKPAEHMKQEGHMEVETENKNQYVEKPPSRTRSMRVANNLMLEGPIDMNPEYRNAYVDFRKELSSPVRRPRRISQESHLKSEGAIEINPEYRSSFVDHPRQRPRVRKPTCSLSSEGEMEHLTEKNAQYVPFSNYKKTEPVKREPELKLEGRFECQPEYRKAFIDYLIREKIERKPRPIDQISAQSKEFERKKTDDSDFKPVHPVPPPSTTDTTSQESSSPPRKSLSRLESTAFGPRLAVPTPRRPSCSSRSSSPQNPPCNRRGASLPPRPSRQSRKSSSRFGSPVKTEKRFGSPVKVENLACREPKGPVVAVSSGSGRRRWQKDATKGEERAFVVLDDKYDLNRNYRELYKEQKWMPSWYNASL